MELHFLGTGAGIPSRERTVQAVALRYVVRQRPDVWLFDCGEGTQHQILRSHLKLSHLTKVFLTHLHGDHVYGLPGLLTSRSSQGSTMPLTLYGPPGVRQLVETTLTLTYAHLTYPLTIVEIEEGLIGADDGIEVQARWLDHVVPSVGYRITQPTEAGHVLMDKINSEGIPSGPWVAQLKRGEPIRLPDGRALDPAMYLGPSRPGLTVAILGDTRPSEQGVELAHRAHALVHEATFARGEAERAPAYGHSTAADAATVARNAEALSLVLTHISSRYAGGLDDKLLREAQEIFPNAFLARDFSVFEITRDGLREISSHASRET